MRTKELLVHCYCERNDDVWLAFCLDFTLVAQAETLDEAMRKLDSQIREYLHDATIGDDRPHAKYLLTRRAPLAYWLKFWLTYAQQRWHNSGRRRSIFEPLPMIPALC